MIFPYVRLCYSCVQNATQESLDFVAYSAKEAIIIYKECMLWYAQSYDLFHHGARACTIIMYYTHATEMGNIIKTELEALIDQATKSPDYFAVARVNNVIEFSTYIFESNVIRISPRNNATNVYYMP